MWSAHSKYSAIATLIRHRGTGWQSLPAGANVLYWEIHTYLSMCSQGIEDGSLNISFMPRETSSDQEAILNKTYICLYVVTSCSWEAKLSAGVLKTCSWAVPGTTVLFRVAWALVCSGAVRWQVKSQSLSLGGWRHDLQWGTGLCAR